MNELKNIVTRIFGLIPLLLSLSACESVMTEQQIKEKYANATINSFIKDRYTHPAANKVADKFDHFASYFNKANKTSPKVIEPQELIAHAGPSYMDYSYRVLSDGKSVVYPAHFTSVNDEFLYKPFNELYEFCSIQGGSLLLKKRFRKELTGLYENPDRIYAKAVDPDLVNSFDSLMASDIVHGNSSLTDAAVQSVVFASMEAANSNNYVISKRYRNAYEHNAFGAYVCRRSKGQNSLWGVAIRPIAFYHRDYENNSDNVLLLLLTPVDEAHHKSS